MAIKNRQELKTYFETGDVPTQNQFEHLIDSSVNRSQDKANLAEAADDTNDEKYITPKTAKRVVETHLPAATTSDAGIVRRSTSTEVAAGANVNAYVTPLNTKSAIEDLAPDLAPVQSVNGQTGAVVTDSDSGWIFPALENGYVNFNTTWYGAVRYRKRNGVVYIEGLVKGGAANARLFKLPQGFNPYFVVIMTGISYANSEYYSARININGTGEVHIHTPAGEFTSLAGISFIVD
jgi:hypothetical protein